MKEHDRTATTYKNDVDLSRSNLNWGYGASDKSADEVIRLIQKRCNEIMDGRKMQDNTNIMSDWVITYPFEFCTPTTDANGKTYNKPNDMAHCKKFFDTVYEFTCNRYGKENVIAGYVHMDETTPHIDINFVPEAISRKNGQRTVSSASLLTKTELSGKHKNGFQRNLEEQMELTFGQKGMILNGRTKGNYTVSELKQRTKDTHDLQVREENVQMQESALHELEIAQAEALAQERDELHLNAQQEYQDCHEELDAERADVWLEHKQNERDRKQIENDMARVRMGQKQIISDREKLDDEIKQSAKLYSEANEMFYFVEDAKKKVKSLLASTEQFTSDRMSRMEQFMSGLQGKDGRTVLEMFRAKEEREKSSRFQALDEISSQSRNAVGSFDILKLPPKARNKFWAELKKLENEPEKDNGMER